MRGHLYARLDVGQINIVSAIGPRPILDMPDQIVVPPTAVKIASLKTVMVRNVGDAPATFNFCSDQ